MAHRLIVSTSLIAFLGFGADRLVERDLQGVGTIELPRHVEPPKFREPYDEDASRLTFAFAHEYGWASLGSSTAYRQLLHVSLMAPDATPADYRRWPSRFEPLYSGLERERELAIGTGRLAISVGRYAQNALDEPAHVYTYADPARRLQIAWHVVDADLAPDRAIALVPRIAASFSVRDDRRAQFAEMRDRPRRERERRQAALALARATLAKAGFGGAAPGRPVERDGVYAEWMDDPEPRFQLLKPLGIVQGALPTPPRFPAADAARPPRGSFGWRARVDGAWTSDNRDNAYLPFDGMERELAKRQTAEGTVLYYYATTVRVAVADEATIAALGGFFAELPLAERAWRASR